MIAIAAVAVAPASASPAKKKLIVVVADNVGFRDWATSTLTILRGLESRGALGLMVTRSEATTLRPDSVEVESGAYLTLGSGLPAVGDANGPLALNYDEPYEARTAGTIYSVRTGRPLPANGIIHLGIGAFKAKNAETQWEARPGALGGLLNKSGLRTAAVGNADVFERYERGAAIIAMDENGRIDAGDVSTRMTLIDPGSPMGMRTNIEELKKATLAAYGRADFIVVDFGDTNRVDRFGSVADEAMYEEARLAALKSFGGFLEWLSRAVDLRTAQVIVLSPTPPRGANKIKETLTPVFMFGAGVPARSSIITTQSTRRPGLIKNTDIAAHVCAFFGIAPAPDFIGSPLGAAQNANPTEFLLDLFTRDAFVESQIDLLKVIIIWHLVLLLICFLTALRLDKSARWLRILLTGVILWTASMFLSFLLLGGIPQISDDLTFVGTFFGLAALIALAAGMIPGYQWKILALSCFYIIALVADQLTGAQLISHSVLGYYPQVGARFYGIGNEYMGFLIGAPLVLFGMLMDSFKDARRWLVAAMPIVFAGLVVVVGAPFIGANFGGLISCMFGYTLMVLLVLKGRLNWKSVLIAGAAVVVFCALSVFADLKLHGSESHVARLVERIAEGGGFAEFVKVVVRKLSVNVRLLRVSFWSALFVVTMAVTLAIHYFPVERLSKLFDRFDYFRRAYLAALGGAIAAFFFNDSGIVPATTALILPTAGVFLLLFNQKTKPTKKQDSRDYHSGGRKYEHQSRSIVLKESDKGKQSSPPKPEQKQGGAQYQKFSGDRKPQQGQGRQAPQGGQNKSGDQRPQQKSQPQRPQQTLQQDTRQGRQVDKPQQGGMQKPQYQPQQHKTGGQGAQPGGQQGQQQKSKRNRPRRRKYYGPPGTPRPPQGSGGGGKPQG